MATHMARKRIGEVLLERRIISQEQLDQALTVQIGSGKRVGETLVEQRAISESQLASAVADALQLPRVDLAQLAPDWKAIHLVPLSICERYLLIPFGVDSSGKQLLVAMSDPLDQAAIDDIELTTGLKVSPRVATLSGIRSAILRYYHKVQPPLPPEPVEMATSPSEPPVPPPSSPSMEEDLNYLFGEASDPLSRASAEALRTFIRHLLNLGKITQADVARFLEP